MTFVEEIDVLGAAKKAVPNKKHVPLVKYVTIFHLQGAKLFPILEFFQKNKQYNSIIVLLDKKTEFVRSFFWKIVGLKKPLK